MKAKQLVVLCSILVILIGLVVLKKGLSPRVATVDEYSDIVEEDVSIDTLTEIYVRVVRGDAGKEIHAQKTGEVWSATSHFNAPILNERIEPFVKKIDSLEGDLRSNDVMLLTDYGISDEHGIYLSLKRDQSIIAELILATKKSGTNGNFVRVAGSSAVYAVGDDLLADLGIWDEDKIDEFDASVWLDTRFLFAETQEVTGVSIKRPKEALCELRKEGDGDKDVWIGVVEYPFAIDSEKVMRYLEDVQALRAETVLAQDGEYGFDVPYATIRFETSGDAVTVVIGEVTGVDGYYMSVSGVGYVYKVMSSVVETLVKNVGDFFVNNPLALRDSDIDTMTFRDVEKGDVCSVVRRVEETTYMQGEEEKSRRDTVWRIDDGNESKISRDKVKSALQKLEDIPLRVMDADIEVKDGNVFVVTVAMGEAKKEYSFSKPILIDSREFHVVTISEDGTLYIVNAPFIESLRVASGPLFEKKNRDKRD